MRVGILSFAHVHADGYLEILRDLDGVDLIGFSDDDPVRAAGVSERYGVAHLGGHEALLAAGVDAVVICSENLHQRAHVELAAAAGAHILCEKPIATRLDDARAMKRAVDAAGVLFMTAFDMRFVPGVIAAREMLLRGDLGRLYAINGVNHAEIPRAHRAWFADPLLAGGGAVMDHTVHLLDLYRWLTGREPTEVYAEIGNPFHPDVEVDTAGLLSVSFPDDVFAVIDCSWSRPEGIYPRFGHLKLELIGERGAIDVDALADYLELYSATEPRPASWLGWGSSASGSMVEAFIDSARRGSEPPVTWFDGYQALRVALAAYASAERGAPVLLGD